MGKLMKEMYPAWSEPAGCSKRKKSKYTDEDTDVSCSDDSCSDDSDDPNPDDSGESDDSEVWSSDEESTK